MNENITKAIQDFDTKPSWEPLFSIANEYFNAEKYQQALPFIAGCLQMGLDETSLSPVYTLAYKIFNKLELYVEAKKYFDACLSMDKRNLSLLDDYKKFYDVPMLHYVGMVNSPLCWFDVEKIKPLGEATKIEDHDLVAVIEPGFVCDDYALQIAFITGADNDKDLVMLADGKSYLVTGRLLKKLKVAYNYFFLEEKAGLVCQVMKCTQATVSPLPSK